MSWEDKIIKAKDVKNPTSSWEDKIVKSKDVKKTEPIKEIPYEPKNDGTFMDNALRVGKGMDDAIGWAGETIVNTPGALYDFAKTTVKAGGELLTNPVNTVKAFGSSIGKTVKSNEIAATFAGQKAENEARKRGENPQEAFDKAYMVSLNENVAQDEEQFKASPNTEKVALPLAQTAATLGTGVLPGLAIGAGVSALDQYSRTGEVDVPRVAGEAIGGGAISAAGSMAGKGVRSAARELEKAPDRLAKFGEGFLLKDKPEAMRYVDNPDLVKQADNIQTTTFDTNKAIDNLKSQHPEIYNSISENLGNLQGKAKEFIDGKYAKMTEAADNSNIPYNPEKNTTGSLIEHLDDGLQDPNVKPEVSAFYQQVKQSFPKDIKQNGRVKRIDNEDGSLHYEVNDLTPGENFSTSFQAVSKAKKILREVKNDQNLTYDAKQNIYKAGSDFIKAFEDNKVGDIPQDVMVRYKEASRAFKENLDQMDIQDRLGSTFKDANTGESYVRPNADKVASFDGKLDAMDRTNIKDSIGNTQKSLDTPEVDLFRGIEENKAGIQSKESFLSDQQGNSVRFNALNSGYGGGIRQGLQIVPYVGKYLAVSPQVQVRIINTLKATKPKLASWVEPIMTAGRPVNVALVKSIALQSRERTEDVAKTLEDLGIKIEK